MVALARLCHVGPDRRGELVKRLQARVGSRLALDHVDVRQLRHVVGPVVLAEDACHRAHPFKLAADDRNLRAACGHSRNIAGGRCRHHRRRRNRRRLLRGALVLEHCGDNLLRILHRMAEAALVRRLRAAAAQEIETNLRLSGLLAAVAPAASAASALGRAVSSATSTFAAVALGAALAAILGLLLAGLGNGGGVVREAALRTLVAGALVPHVETNIDLGRAALLADRGELQVTAAAGILRQRRDGAHKRLRGRLGLLELEQDLVRLAPRLDAPNLRRTV